MDKAKPQDQVQAIYLAQANIFAYEARKSTKSWIPLCDSTIPISILYDNTRSIYRIISVDAEIKEVVVNTTIIPELEFVKTTQKFGYWKDISSGRVFGIGFASEYEAEAFDECLKKVKQNIGPPSVNSSLSLNSDIIDENKKKIDKSFGIQPRTSLQGQGDGQCLPPPFTTGEGASVKKQFNWDDYDQVAPTVLSMINSHQQQQHGGDMRPSTYKVDLPIIRNSTIGAGDGLRVANQKLYANFDDVRLPAPPSAYHHVPFHYLPHQIRPQNVEGTLTSPVINMINAATTIPTPSPIHVPEYSPATSLMPLAMSLPQGFCYQGPQPVIPAPTASSLTDSVLNANPTRPITMMNYSGERRDISEELSRVKLENQKLNDSLLENAYKYKIVEDERNLLRDEKLQLVKSNTDSNMKLDAATKESREHKDEIKRLNDQIHQSMIAVKEKSQQLKDVEEKLKNASEDKARIELIMRNLEEGLKKQHAFNKDSNHIGQYTNKYFKELEDHYRKLLADAQKQIEEILRKDTDRKNVLRGVDTLFTGAIQGLINIHGQIRQSYEQ